MRTRSYYCSASGRRLLMRYGSSLSCFLFFKQKTADELRISDWSSDVCSSDLFDALRSCGLSRQKQGYARSLAELVMTGALDLHALPADDEAAINALVSVKGIGRWSAEIYLLFAEGRPDVWPAGDLAVQIEVGRILGLSERPTEKVTREVAERWRPHRGAAALMAWHHYNTTVL